MRAYGSDRLRLAEDGSLELSSRLPKREWHPRTKKTMTRNERPGTAVLWDDECYEVVDARVLPQGMHYTLRPWAEGEAMRVTTRYDAETEAARDAERRDTIKRERQRRTATAFAFVTGLLPAAVQDRLGQEVNADPAALTLWSTVPLYLVTVAVVLADAARVIREEPMLPLWIHLIVGYLFLETSVRFKIAWLTRRPAGSVIGLIGYSIYYAVTPHRRTLVAPIEAPQGRATPIDISAEDEIQSLLHTLAPLLTLLDTRDQSLLRDRFGFDYRRTARGTAQFLLFVAIIGIASSVHTLMLTTRTSAVTALVVALAIAVEQLWRLAQFPRRPAPSFLRFLVRPLAKRLFS